MLYPAELQAQVERVMGIEPTRPAWKAGVLPLNYTRVTVRFGGAPYHITGAARCQAVICPVATGQITARRKSS